MLLQLLTPLLLLAARAHTTAVLVTYPDLTCTTTYGLSLFAISVDQQCQQMKGYYSFNIDTMAAGCSSESRP